MNYTTQVLKYYEYSLGVPWKQEYRQGWRHQSLIWTIVVANTSQKTDTPIINLIDESATTTDTRIIQPDDDKAPAQKQIRIKAVNPMIPILPAKNTVPD